MLSNMLKPSLRIAVKKRGANLRSWTTRGSFTIIYLISVIFIFQPIISSQISQTDVEFMSNYKKGT